MADTSAHLHAVILAGGSGTRFWPLSRELSPKQMLSIFGGVNLVTRAVRRIAPLVASDAVHVVTGENLFDELRNSLTSQRELDTLSIDYIVEPVARNTAAAIALAAALLVRQDPEAIMIVLPSDHLLEEEAAWADTIRAGIALAAQGLLVTIGLRPSSPETAYGYIRPGEPVAGIAGSGELVGREVIGFVEKPDAATAAAFLAEGGYLWNSGMLVTRADTVLGELRAAGKAAATPASAPGERIADIVTAMADIPREEWFADSVRDAYGSLAAVPFDKAVLEVSGKVAVLPTGLDWSDVGSLLAIEKLGTPDERGNVLVGRVFDIDSRNILAYSVDHLLATLGLEDVIVVDTSDATLVAAKDRAQDVRMLVEALKAAGAPEATRSRESLRPWGSWTLLMEGDGFRVKSIDVLPGSRLSLQSHHRRSEHWIVLDGVARAERDGEVVELRANESIHVPMGSVHRLENAGDTPLKVIEVAVGEYLGEDDIVRYADDWAREDR